MAVVVSHAMRRFPPTQPGSSYSSNSYLGGEASIATTDITQSSLSRSMRYAEPWLYGSVRAPPGLFLTPALILCSCPEYINGTKRSSKKSPTICKKCKGTRLPYPRNESIRNASKFGTVRCYPTSPPISSSATVRSGTVRVTSQNRPSILPAYGETDPYELMRRSRLSPDNGNQFRINPVSSTSTAPTNSSTGTRRSILECDINPYDLMSINSTSKDNSITLVNGQRVRVSPSQTLPEKDYIEVKVQTQAQPIQPQQSQIPKLKAVPSKKTNPPSKSDEKESECNRFKSILKKPTTFSDTDSICGNERSPSPTPKSGSHFYLPMPISTIRKKVQFLDENELCSQKSDATQMPIEQLPTNVYEDVAVNVEHVPGNNTRLRRSISERYLQEPTESAVFHDTTALRRKPKRNDCRNAFDEVHDLRKLDGILRIKSKPIQSQFPSSAPSSLEKCTDTITDNFMSIQQDEVVQAANVRYDISNTTQDINLDKLKQNEEALMELISKPLAKPEVTPSKHHRPAPEPPSAPPRKRSISKIPVTVVEPIGMQAQTPILNISEPVSTHVPTKMPDYQGKTIVQITSSPTVHKIQIKNEFIEPDDNIQRISVSDTTQRKTSILINGDDCYSTINVNDDIPLYRSSVVVKDIDSKSSRSSTVYISNDAVTDADLEIKSLKMTLKQLLQDPVEAVKRNLIPHVCGKTDSIIVHQHPKTVPDVDETPLVQLRKREFIPIIQVENSETFSKSRDRDSVFYDDKDVYSDISSNAPYELLDGSDCYTDTSNRSSVTEEELMARTKFYEMLADSAIAEMSENEDHHYECIRLCPDPIYEEIIPPPLPSNPPPSTLLDDLQLDKQYTTRSIFEGASKYDILSYLVDAKERGIIPEDTYNFGNSDIVVEEDAKEVSDSSEESSLVMADDKFQKSVDIERNDSGVGSETSKSSLSKYRTKPENLACNCEDCDTAVETQSESEPLICRKCMKKRTERKEIISEIVETEEKYSRDLQIILEEFYQPMLVAGLLTSDQLSAIFLNVEELLENSQALAERLRDAVEIASEQGDEDLLTVNIGKLFLEAAPMLHAFETYCIRQGSASLLLASLEKDKELLRIFLRVSQMENTMLRRMNLNSFLMVPVQRVTKYPLLLTRLYKSTPTHHESRDQLKEAQHKIELHLNHMNSETKDVPSKLWRRIGSNSGRRCSAEMDLVSIKLRKIAVDVLEWNHDDARFVLEGRLLFTQPTDNNWRKGRTIKLAPINALLVTNGKHQLGTRTEDDGLTFPRNGIREAALLLVRDKNGRYSLIREPLFLDRCIVATDPAWQSYFEVQEIIGKDTFIFKADDDELTATWYRQLQFHAQGLGGWRKRRNALANIMINGRGSRS